ncbi:hypothetical protein BH10ACI1_BH10ACI1_05620 [soil metagenome]
MKRNSVRSFASNRKGTGLFFAAIGLFVFLLPFAAYWSQQAAGTISGRVFQDFNGNGTYDTTATITNDGVGTVGVAIDLGVSGITVSAYDSAGVLRGTATTIADGTYSVAAAGTGPYRIEFTNLPTGFLPSARSTDSSAGGTTTNSGSTVQFVANGTTTNVNLAINNPNDYSQNNPEVVASLYKAGDQATGASNFPVLVSFPYSAGSNDTSGTANLALYDAPTINPLSLSAIDLGTTYGLAYAKTSRLIYAGAYFKRHAGFGPNGPNQIYVVNRTGSGNVQSSFTVPGTATNLHDTTNYPRDNGNIGWDAVGKSSLGGITISEDEASLFVYNLANRTLYKLNASNGTQVASQATLPTLPVASGNCGANDRRPFALTIYRGVLYAGFVCSAESSTTVDTFTDANSNGQYDGGDYYIETNGTPGRQATESYLDLNGNGSYDAGEAFVDNDGNGVYNIGDARSLRAYVFTVDQTTLAYSASPVLTVPLNYPRGIAQRSSGAFAQWRPWSATYRNVNSNATRTVYPQPVLTDIAFDKGNIVLGLRDRASDQVGNGTLSNPADASNTNFYQPRPGGDVIRACGAIGAWTVESNGRCGGTGTATQNSGEGIGNGEFYYGDSFSLSTGLVSPAVTVNGKGSNHDETPSGGVEQLPGAPDVMIVNFDPIANVLSETHDGGVRWLSNTTGNFTKGFRLYDGASGTGNDFGKSGGTGGNLTILADPAPIELGNRVWRDTNNDGVQDSGENGIIGVTVRLYNASNTLIATAVTDANGEYYFVSGTAADGNITDNIGIINGKITPNTNYQIRLDLAANYTGAGPLTGLLMTTRDQTSQLGFDDGSDSDSSLVVNPTNSPAGTFPVITLTTGSAGDSNHNFDVGFASSATYSIGNRVWLDTNNDGMINAGEVGISGVSVSIFLDANGDGVPDNLASPVATQSTDVNGYYRFDTLSATNYVIRINPSNFANAAVLGGYANTAGNNNTDLDSTSVAGQNGENGINPAGAANSVQTNGILSGSINLGPPGEPVSEADVQASGQGSIDAAANMTVDFGFYRACISGTVWNDNGAGANNNNGILNVGESMIPAVRVQLYNSSNTEITVGPDGILGTSDDTTNGMVTNGSGNYSFCGLPPGQYRLVVTTPGGTSSTPTSINPDDNVDNDDNGFPGTSPFVGKTTSGLVTVTPGSTGTLNNKTVTNSTGTTLDPTIDFGFVLPPTAIQLEDFTVYTDGNSVSLKWSTGGESGNLGFNLYRETNGRRELVNSAPIAGSGLRTSANLLATGDNYNWVDKEAKSNSVYYLEDIDFEGNRTIYGPVAPIFRISLNKFEQNPLLVSDLAIVPNPSAQTEFVGEKAENTNSALNPSRQFEIARRAGVKISVNHDGWYKVPAATLQANGFDVNSNRAYWQLFVGGEEVAMKVNNDGAIEFFGRGVETTETDRQIYYLISGQTIGTRLKEVKSSRAEENPLSSYSATAERKDRSIYVSSILNGDTENWFGPIINSSSQTVQSLSLVNIETNASARLRVKLQGLTTGGHLVNVRINDTDLGQISYENLENREFEFDVPSSALIEGTNNVKLQSAGTSSDFSLVDTVDLSYSRLYKAVNNQIRFSVPAGQSVKVGGFSTGKIAVNEIQNGAVGVRVAAYVEESNGEASFELSAAGSDREFLAVALVQAEEAAAVEPNLPSDLNNSSNRADFVIIAPAIFQTQAAQLAQMRQNQGLRSQVVLAEDVADEYGYGILTADAVKQFLQNATANWRVKPHYVLLFGDSSYDSRNYLEQSNRNLVPTKLLDTVFMETSSDTWLADFNEDGIEDIAIGRLPAATETESKDLISKIVRYDNQPNRAERISIFASDRTFENNAQTMQDELPQGISSVRIDRAAMTDAEMHSQIMSNLNNNPLVTVYTGHGSTGVWANSAIFKMADAANLTNFQLGFYLLTTCLNGYTHNAYGDSLAEGLMKNGQGGAIAVWASSGTNFPQTQATVSQAVMRMIFNPQKGRIRIGDIIREAKQITADQDVRRNYLLLGDPTLVIK